MSCKTCLHWHRRVDESGFGICSELVPADAPVRVRLLPLRSLLRFIPTPESVLETRQDFQCSLFTWEHEEEALEIWKTLEDDPEKARLLLLALDERIPLDRKEPMLVELGSAIRTEQVLRELGPSP